MPTIHTKHSSRMRHAQSLSTSSPPGVSSPVEGAKAPLQSDKILFGGRVSVARAQSFQIMTSRAGTGASVCRTTVRTNLKTNEPEIPYNSKASPRLLCPTSSPTNFLPFLSIGRSPSPFVAPSSSCLSARLFCGKQRVSAQLLSSTLYLAEHL